MNQIAIIQYARQLSDQFGSRALVIAGQRRRILEEAGEFDKAALWGRIRKSLEQMREASPV
jgi:hypothetical protein